MNISSCTSVYCRKSCLWQFYNLFVSQRLAGFWNMKRWNDEVFSVLPVFSVFSLRRNGWLKSFLLTPCVASALKRLMECDEELKRSDKTCSLFYWYRCWLVNNRRTETEFNQWFKFKNLKIFSNQSIDGIFSSPITSSPSNNQVNSHHSTNSAATQKVIELRKNYSGECISKQLALTLQNWQLITKIIT